MLVESSSGLPPQCSGALTIDAIVPSTVLTLTAEQTYSEIGAVVLDWSFLFDLPCVSALAGRQLTTADIPVFCGVFESESREDPTSPFVNLTCSTSQGACACDAQQSEPLDNLGSFVIDNQTLRFDDGRVAPFCVNGDDLTLVVQATELGDGTLSYTRAQP